MAAHLETMTETTAGTILLEGLEAYRAGDFDGARDAAHRARAASPDAFAARYCDSLAYDAISRRHVLVAEHGVRRALIALSDPRQAVHSTPFGAHATTDPTAAD